MQQDAELQEIAPVNAVAPPVPTLNSIRPNAIATPVQAAQGLLDFGIEPVRVSKST
jgi:hypothetical protein